jgi:hypothetical protein
VQSGELQVPDAHELLPELWRQDGQGGMSMQGHAEIVEQLKSKATQLLKEAAQLIGAAYAIEELMQDKSDHSSERDAKD